MMNILLPEVADNKFKGNRIASSGYMCLSHSLQVLFICLHRMAVLKCIGSVKLDSFTQGGADSVVTMFGLWGMEQFVIGLIVLVFFIYGVTNHLFL